MFSRRHSCYIVRYNVIRVRVCVCHRGREEEERPVIVHVVLRLAAPVAETSQVRVRYRHGHKILYTRMRLNVAPVVVLSYTLVVLIGDRTHDDEIVILLRTRNANTDVRQATLLLVFDSTVVLHGTVLYCRVAADK